MDDVPDEDEEVVSPEEDESPEESEVLEDVADEPEEDSVLRLSLR